MSKSLKVVFMGTPTFAVPGLRSIVESHHKVVGVVTAPDRPAGRGKKLRFSAIKDEALAQNIPLFQPEKLSTDETVAQLKALKADVFVVVAFRMLPKVIWSIPPLGTFNLHASLLPQYRGAAPIHWAVIHGEKETGLTTFLIDEKIDTGAILLQKKLRIRSQETMGELSLRMQMLSGSLIMDTLDGLATNRFDPTPQIHDEKCIPAPKLTRENTQIDWYKSGIEIVHFIHGLNPFPTAWTTLETDLEVVNVKIQRAHFVASTPTNTPGHISIDEKQLRVSVSDGYVYIDKLQLPNKKSMETRSLLNGYQFPEKCRFV